MLTLRPFAKVNLGGKAAPLIWSLPQGWVCLTKKAYRAWSSKLLFLLLSTVWNLKTVGFLNPGNPVSCNLCLKTSWLLPELTSYTALLSASATNIWLFPASSPRTYGFRRPFRLLSTSLQVAVVPCDLPRHERISDIPYLFPYCLRLDL